MNGRVCKYNMSEERVFIAVVSGIITSTIVSFSTVWLRYYLNKKNAKRKDKHNDNVRNEGQGER